MADTLRSRLIRLAHARPELRHHLVPLLKTSMAYGTPVGALESGVKTLARRLEAMGIKTEIDTYKAGGGHDFYQTSATGSYVELIVTASYYDEVYGAEEEAYEHVKFIANGYGDEVFDRKRHEVGGAKGFKHMATQAWDFILRSLERQGWKKP